MNKFLILLGVALSAMVVMNADALDVNVGVGVNKHSNYYDNRANAYAEGTVSTVGADGRVTLRGSESPYAQNYTTYHKEYYSIPEAERQARARELNERYKDKLSYQAGKDEKDFNFSITNREKFHVYDESTRYGHSSDKWAYTTPRTYTYGDIKPGDRVVVGYDSQNPSTVHSMYRVKSSDNGVDVKIKN